MGFFLLFSFKYGAGVLGLFPSLELVKFFYRRRGRSAPHEQRQACVLLYQQVHLGQPFGVSILNLYRKLRDGGQFILGIHSPDVHKDKTSRFLKQLGNLGHQVLVLNIRTLIVGKTSKLQKSITMFSHKGNLDVKNASCYI